MVVLIGGMIYMLLREIGHGQYFWSAIVGSILLYIWIWQKPSKKANK